MQAAIQRVGAAAHSRETRRTGTAEAGIITRRLSAEFPAVAHNDVQRCVTDTWICAQHLGLAVTERQVEQVAREHLLGLVNSVPPSGRPSLP